MSKRKKVQPLSPRAKRIIWFMFMVGLIVGIITLSIILSIYKSID